MTKKLVQTLSLVLSVVFLYSCSETETISSEIKRGVHVVQYMAAKRQIQRSSFRFTHPEGKPSDYVNWMFSALGAAVWPDTEDMAEMDPMIAEQAKSIGAPLIPKGVRILPLSPNPEFEKQIVVKFDNDRRLLIVEGYLDSKGIPVITKELKFPDWNSSKT